VTTEEISRLLFSLIDGGSVAGIINLIRTSTSEKISRKIEDMDDQTRKLYGQPYSFASQNEEFLKLYQEFHKIYREEYSNKNWGNQKDTQKELEYEVQKALEIANKYIKITEKNNSEIATTLSKRYTCIDREDINTSNNSS